MQRALAFLAILFFAGSSFALANTYPGSAPADEYFGPHHQSILEIRNRLDGLDAIEGREMMNSNIVVSLDDLQTSILDWQRKYPDDPWLPRMLAHLTREYQRAGYASSEHATMAFNVLRTAYPDSPETIATVAALYGTSMPVSQEAVAQAPIVEQAPIVSETPVVTAPLISPQNAPAYVAQEDPWARFARLHGDPQETVGTTAGMPCTANCR